MKICVITLHTVNNYGSVLQTYATNYILEKMGHQVIFVDYWRKNNTIDSRIDNLLNKSYLHKFSFLWKRNNIIKKTISFLLKQFSKKRNRSTRSFIKKNIKLTRPYYSFTDLLKSPPLADIYVTGSDQVWNSIWNEGIEKPYYLEFAPTGKKRIAFAASIGMNEIPENEVMEMKEMLKKYNAISVREQSGVELLKKIGIDSQLILDPTLMLKKDEWIKTAYPIKRKKPFIVVYQLNINHDMDKYVEQLARKKKIDVIRLSYGRSDKKKYGKWILMPRVEDFLGYLYYSKLIITDSFHITSFALNLNKQFITFSPQRFSTRITNILKLTHTERRLITNYNDYSLIDEEIDWETVNGVLEIERKKGMRWLRDALDK